MFTVSLGKVCVSWVCAVRWAVPTLRWIWTRRVYCQTAWVENDLSPLADLILAGDAPTPTRSLRRRPPRRLSSPKEPRSPRTGLLLNALRHSTKTAWTHFENALTLPGGLLSVFCMQLYPVVGTWERVICVARKPVTVDAERLGRNNQPEPLGGASEQSHNGTRPKRYQLWNHQT